MGQLAANTGSVKRKRPGKLDRILADCDVEDRATLLGWLHDATVGDEDIEFELWDRAGIECSDSTIRRWRRSNRVGLWAD